MVRSGLGRQDGEEIDAGAMRWAWCGVFADMSRVGCWVRMMRGSGDRWAEGLRCWVVMEGLVREAKGWRVSDVNTWRGVQWSCCTVC